MTKQELKVEFLNELDTNVLDKTFYEILFEKIISLHKQKDNNSNA